MKRSLAAFWRGFYLKDILIYHIPQVFAPLCWPACGLHWFLFPAISDTGSVLLHSWLRFINLSSASHQHVLPVIRPCFVAHDKDSSPWAFKLYLLTLVCRKQGLLEHSNPFWEITLCDRVTQISLFSPIFTAHYKSKTTYLKHNCGLLRCHLLRKSSVFWALAEVTWSVAPLHNISSWCHSTWSWHQQRSQQQPVSSS